MPNCTDATAIANSSVLGIDTSSIRVFAANPETPTKLKSKLNPAVEAFTPSSSSGKDSAKSSTMQATAPTKNESKSEVTTKTSKDENFIPPHLRRHSKIADKEETVTAIDELSSKDKIKDQDTVVISAKKEVAKGFGQLQATSMNPGILPHLRRMTNVSKDGDLFSSYSQYSGKGKDKAESTEGRELLSRAAALAAMKENVKAATTPAAFVRHDPGLEAWLNSQEPQSNNASTTREATSTATDTLIEVDPDYSLKAGEEKIVPVPPGFIPMSSKEAPVKTETAAPAIVVGDRVTYRNPTAEPSPAQASSKNPTSEKENNARFLKEYNRRFSTLSEKYGKESRQTSDDQEAEEAFDPIKFSGANPVSIL